MDIRLSEIVAALSHALDVTEGQPMGHAERSCLIGLRLSDATDLGLGDRILQVADVAEALSAERPYRAALGVDEVLSIMGRDAGPKLDAGAFAALAAWLPGRDASFADAA